MPTGNLSGKGKSLWEKIYNASIKAGDSKETAARKAWAGVKSAGWHKKDGKWMKSDAIVEMSMYITKAQTDTKGVMRWQAVNSDTDYDSYVERMSVDLYRDFIGRILSGEKIPEIYKSVACSDYWCGGMPYVSVSHYPDLNGGAVPGEVLELFVDGNKLKAKGYLFDSPLGHAVYRSLKEDKEKPPEEKIRISIGFLDLAHKHGDEGKVWVRDGLYALCPACLEGVGDKVYVKGYLVHLALTRVPVNKRTEMVLEEKAEMTPGKKKTRKEDAASIVGKDLAEEIDAKNKVSAQRSDALIEMSDSEEPTEEETRELVAEAEAPTSVTLTVDENGKPVGEKPGVVASTTDPRGYKEVEKSDAEKSEPVGEKSESAETVVVEENMDSGYSMPYGGATSMKEAEKHMKAKEEMIHVMDMWSMFSNVAWNIIEREDIPNKKAAFVSALDEFKSMLSAKAMLEFAVIERSEVEEEKPHELQSTIDTLLQTVDNSVQLAETERAEAINPALQTLGTAILDYLQRKSVTQETPAQDKNTDNLLENIKQLIQPISDAVTQMSERVGVLEARSQVQTVEVSKPRIPQPRTISPALLKKAEPETKPGSLRDIINKSVGL